MSNVQKKDLAVIVALAFDFVAAASSRRYPLWTVHSPPFRAVLSVAFWMGVISSVGLPVWLVIRLLREPDGRGLKVVELGGALCWFVALGYLVISEFTVI